MSTAFSHLTEHRLGFCNFCGFDLDDQRAELASRRQIIDFHVVRPTYTEHRIFRNICACGRITKELFLRG